jgi:kynurenine 3-monooxygenase
MTDNVDEPLKIAIIGAGLAGTVLAALFERLPGVRIVVLERRLDEAEEQASAIFGNAQNAFKRSINLALSHRGIVALDELNLTEEVLKMAIRMPKRVIHDRNDNIKLQPYGKGEETLWSVGRADLNKFLIRCISSSKSNVEVRTGHTLLSAEEDGRCHFRSPRGEYDEKFDFVIGADGAYSRVRETMLRMGRVSFNRLFIKHGYKEFTIPPVKDADGNDQFALKEPEGIHIWPKGDLMLIALPNPDKSFTATLFAPYTTVYNVVSKDNDKEVMDFFNRVFPETLQYLPHVLENFRENPIGPLMTLRVDPWKLGKFMLIGDAAHAVVPFYGQGMNAAFEDAHQFYRLLKPRMEAANTLAERRRVFNEVAEQFSVRRKQAVDVLSDLCLEHYHDMASNTSSWWYLFQHKLQNIFLPASVKNLYRYIAFSDVPYDEALQRSKCTETLFRFAIFGTMISAAAGVVGSAWFWRHKLLK